eukprot:5896054-Amphidinium_carterae.1
MFISGDLEGSVGARGFTIPRALSVELELHAAKIENIPHANTALTPDDRIRVTPRQHADPQDVPSRPDVATEGAIQKQSLRHKTKGIFMLSHRCRGDLAISLQGLCCSV